MGQKNQMRLEPVEGYIPPVARCKRRAQIVFHEIANICGDAGIAIELVNEENVIVWWKNNLRMIDWDSIVIWSRGWVMFGNVPNEGESLADMVYKSKPKSNKR